VKKAPLKKTNITYSLSCVESRTYKIMEIIWEWEPVSGEGEETGRKR
jgi:hypothetical protein